MFFPRISALLALSQVVSLCIVSICNADTSSVTAENPRVLMSTTEGDMVIELTKDRAPVSVDNFLKYVEDGFYNDTIFHRVIEGFMIQGGGFAKNYSRKMTRATIVNEANNGLSNLRYTIAMARTNAPHSAMAQFFINSEDNTNLDHRGATARGWGYAVFGRVVEGQNVVDKISRVPTGPGGPFSRDTPRTPVVINKVSLIVPPVTETTTEIQMDKKQESMLDTASTGASEGSLIKVQPAQTKALAVQ